MGLKNINEIIGKINKYLEIIGEYELKIGDNTCVFEGYEWQLHLYYFQEHSLATFSYKHGQWVLSTKIVDLSHMDMITTVFTILEYERVSNNL